MPLNPSSEIKLYLLSADNQFLIGSRVAASLKTGMDLGGTLMASGTETILAAEKLVAATVLIVDDENTTRDLCRDIAVESGLRTRTASTTEQALEILERTQWT